MNVDTSAGWMGLGMSTAGVAVPLSMIPVAAGLSLIQGPDEGEPQPSDLATFAAGFSVWLLPPAAILASHVQMVRHNRRPIPITDLTVTPMRTEQGGGLALRARF